MVDVDTFLTTLYVLADEFCKEFLPPEIRPGPDASLAPSEVVTLAIFGQLCRFESERSFYRYADRNLRPAFPTLPHRPQLNRLVRCQRDAITGFALHLSKWLVPGEQPFELMDCVAARTRDSRRRGPGWLPQAMRGRSNRIGWYIGFNVLTVTSPNGVITGFGFGPGNANERSLAETLFCARDSPEPRLPSAGRTRAGAYLADTGFWGPDRQALWRDVFGIEVYCPPERKTRWRWSKELRRRFARYRQIIESVHNRLLHPFRLELERPHDLYGFAARLAAKVALHNFFIWFNRELGRPLMAYAELIDW
jgi:hypothetical protein